jgi:hypothetical protein
MWMFEDNTLFVLFLIAIISRENHSWVALYMVTNANRYCCVSLPLVIKQSFLCLLFVIISQLITPLRCDITLFVMRKTRADLDS